MFKVVKTYGHDRGLSTCFRQPAATHSHCSLLHGYALAFEITFRSVQLDHRNWVIDFGALGWIKNYLEETFDHTLLVAENDPQKDMLCSLQGLGLARTIVLPTVGCEAFARMVYKKIQNNLDNIDFYRGNVWVDSVKVSEHGANSAFYTENPY